MHDVLHTGERGEVINVKPGFARNYLFPNGYAREATAGNLRLFEQRKKKIEIQHAAERQTASELAAQIQGVGVTIAKRVGESEKLYGSVTAAEVAEALEHVGIHIDRRRIDLEGGIKTLGEHPVRIDLHSDVSVELTVTVVAEE
jgi:large subunit ribosomal protein L9